MQFKMAILLLISLVFMWGINWPINKIGLEYTSPTNFIEWRFILSTIAVFALSVFTKTFIIPRKKDLMLIVTVGFFQLGLMISLCNYGLSLVDAGKASFLVYATSIWTIPIAAFLDKQLNRFDVLGFVVGLCGVIFLMSPWEKQWIWQGDLILLLSSLSWSIGLMCSRRLKGYHSSSQLFPWQLLVATIFTMIVAHVGNVSLMPNTIGVTFLISLFYTSIIAIAVASWIMIRLTQELKASLISLGLILVPIFAMGISYLFLRERISWSLLTGVVLILIGILMHHYSERKIKKEVQAYNDAP